MKGTVPTGKGLVSMEVDLTSIRIQSTFGKGSLVIESKELPECANGIVRSIGSDRYEITIEAGESYIVSYNAFNSYF